MQDLSNLSAKLYRGRRTDDPDPQGHTGTAWLCSRDYALTAAHCVREKTHAQPPEDLWTLCFRWGRLFTTVAWIDDKLDAALLRIADGETEQIPGQIDDLLLADLPENLNEGEKAWNAYGFPIAKVDGMMIEGAITHIRGWVGDSPAIQITCDQGGLGRENVPQGERTSGLEGTSGAALIHNGAAVGVVIWGPPHLEHRVIFACPLSAIAAQCAAFQQLLTENQQRYDVRSKVSDEIPLRRSNIPRLLAPIVDRQGDQAKIKDYLLNPNIPVVLRCDQICFTIHEQFSR